MKLTLQNVAVDRGARTIISDVSFDLSAGEALTFKGPNGVGKTTLMRAIAGFLKPSEGTIALSGAGPEAAVAENAHYVGHLNAIKLNQTVWDNLKFWAAFYGATQPDEACHDAITRFELAPLTEIPAGYLSAGQKRRLALARLLSAPRSIWLLDEPTVSLDTHATRLLADCVDQHVTRGGLVIAATHIPLGISGERVLELTPGPVDGAHNEGA